MRIQRNEIKVKPYSIHGSFSKLEYLKTEFNLDNGTYATVKVTSHNSRIMVNLSLSGYFEVLWHPLKNISGCVSFFGKISRLVLCLKMRVYHMSIHVFGKVQFHTSTGDLHEEYFKNIFECSHKPHNY